MERKILDHHAAENRNSSKNSPLKKFKKFLTSSTFALMVIIHPPVLYAQEEPVDPEIVLSTPDSSSMIGRPTIEENPNPVINPVGSTPEAWIDYFAQQTGISAGYARSIAICESRLDPTARNRSGAAGFWQIMPSRSHRQFYINHGYDPDTDWNDGAANTLVAVDIAHSEGIGAWNCA